ncbi:MAG: hypothetical protein M1839_001279 [Geoglossum umbratile]|nr:MAG: hypothetical protein M1839_001279 [Geoglossum umbratile]
MRSSPIVCLVDATEVLSLLAYYTLRGNWPREAAQLVARYRFQDLDEAADEFASVGRNRYVRLTVFVLGALPQAVKLCAMTGVPWTKAWGAMYLVSFGVVELVLVMAGYEESQNYMATEETPEVEGRGGEPVPKRTAVRLLNSWIWYTHFHGLLAMWFQAMLCMWALNSAISGILTNGRVSNASTATLKALAVTLSPIYLASAAWLYISACISVGVVVSALGHRRLLTISLGAAITAPVAVAAGLHIQSYARLVGLLRYGGAYFAFFLVHLLVVPLLLYWVKYSTQSAALPVRSFPFLANLLAALLYYCLKYNPEGTSKPSWTDVLG